MKNWVTLVKDSTLALNLLLDEIYSCLYPLGHSRLTSMNPTYPLPSGRKWGGGSMRLGYPCPLILLCSPWFASGHLPPGKATSLVQRPFPAISSSGWTELPTVVDLWVLYHSPCLLLWKEPLHHTLECALCVLPFQGQRREMELSWQVAGGKILTLQTPSN